MLFSHTFFLFSRGCSGLSTKLQKVSGIFLFLLCSSSFCTKNVSSTLGEHQNKTDTDKYRCQLCFLKFHILPYEINIILSYFFLFSRGCSGLSTNYYFLLILSVLRDITLSELLFLPMYLRPHAAKFPICLCTSVQAFHGYYPRRYAVHCH